MRERQVKATCSAGACDRPARSRGLCTNHYSRAKRAGQLWPLPPAEKPAPAPPSIGRVVTTCEVPDRWSGEPCGGPAGARRLCQPHSDAYASLVGVR